MTDIRDDDDLIPLLMDAHSDDLAVLVDYITDEGAGRLSLDNTTMSKLVAAKARGTFTEEDRLLIAHEVRLFGGNSLANLARRGQGVAYQEIVHDVATHLKVMHSATDPVVILENSILEVIAARAWEKMSESEKTELLSTLGVGKGQGFGPAALAALIAAIRASGFAAYKFATVVANAVARQLLGRGLAFGAMAPVMQGMAALAGPIGWVVTALWGAFDLASPAYRVTVPCVIQIAFMRKKWQAAICSSCGAPNSPDAKFCPECGTQMPIIVPQSK